MLKTLVCIVLLIVAAFMLLFTKPHPFLFELMRKSLGTEDEKRGARRYQENKSDSTE